jgi:hypothetical protein
MMLMIASWKLTGDPGNCFLPVSWLMSSPWALIMLLLPNGSRSVPFQDVLQVLVLADRMLIV